MPLFSRLSAELRPERDRMLGAVHASGTETAYGYDWALFSSWTKLMGRAALPADPETVSLYLTEVIAQGKTVATAVRRASGIAYKHRAAGWPSPVTAEVRALLRGAGRDLAQMPRQMKPLTVAQIRTLSELLGRQGTRAALRDRAILVVGFASALRRSNLAALRLEHVELSDAQVVLHIEREKNDQEGHGRRVSLPRGRHAATCPVRVVRAWLRRRGPGDGPLFPRLDAGARGLEAMEGEAIGRMIHRRAAQIGLEGRDYCGHSLRAGFVTAGGLAGLGELALMAQTGHRSPAMLRTYFRPGAALDVARALGL